MRTYIGKGVSLLQAFFLYVFFLAYILKETGRWGDFIALTGWRGVYHLFCIPFCFWGVHLSFLFSFVDGDGDGRHAEE